MKTIAAFSDDNYINYSSKFKILADKISSYFSALGLAVVPYQDETLPFYSMLSVERKKEALLHLEVYNTCIEACINSGEDFRKGTRSLWYAIKELGYIPNKDMFNLLESDHVIEIYTDEKIQIWRDFNLMTYCTYTLEEIFTYPWTERYIRNSEDIQKIIDASEKAFHPDNRDIIVAMVPNHPVIEKFSMRRLDLTVTHEYFCLLFRAGQHSPAAIVIVSRVVINKSLAEVDGKLMKIPSTPSNMRPNLTLVT